MAEPQAVASQPGLLEKTWERIQKKTFTGWVNSHLSKVGLKIDDLATDFQDGIKMIKLLEVIANDTITGFEKNPGKMRIKQVTNNGIALKFIQSKGVKLPGTGPEEIVDGNAKMILGLIWTIILRFQIQDISEEELSAKEALLLWVQKKTKGYNHVNVQNFHMSFQDGLAFCALIHKHRPDLLDYDSLSKENKLENLELAFDVAEKHLGIAKILDAKDIVDLPKPDERSIMTYVAAMYHVFASYGKADAAAKNVANVIEFAQAAEKLKLEFQTRAKELVEWIEHNTVKLDERNFPHNLEGIQVSCRPPF
jgi:actinin alpha